MPRCAEAAHEGPRLLDDEQFAWDPERPGYRQAVCEGCRAQRTAPAVEAPEPARRRGRTEEAGVPPVPEGVPDGV